MDIIAIATEVIKGNILGLTALKDVEALVSTDRVS